MANPVPVPRPAPNGAAPAAPSAPRPVTAVRPPGTPARVSKLGDVKRGPLATPKRLVFYGTRGIGKSSLAADAPAPIFIDLGNATEHLNVERYPIPETPRYLDVLDAIDDLATNDHAYKTLVIEDLGEMEELMWRHLVDIAPPNREGDKPTGIESLGGGFSKGYTIAASEWRVLVQRLDQLRLRKGMNVIMLGHSTVATIKIPGSENYDRYVPLIHTKAVGVIGANADVVGFVTFDDVAKRITSGSAKKTIGVTGHRVIHLEHSACWDAKSRLPMPAQINLLEVSPWSPFAEAIHRLHTMNPGALRTQIVAELSRIGDPFTKSDGGVGNAAAVRAAVMKAGDEVATLFKYLTTLQQASPMTAGQETP